MRFLTSFNPHTSFARLKRQKDCLDSWRKYNIPIVAIQDVSEQRVEKLFPNLEYIYTNNYNPHFKSTNPHISAFLAETPGIIINSDIDLSWTQQDFYNHIDNYTMGIRTENGELNPWGIDVFICPTRPALDYAPFQIGQPGWDYWLCIELVKKYLINVIKTGMNHEPHDDRWSEERLRTAQTLLSEMYKIPSRQVSLYIKQITGRL